MYPPFSLREDPTGFFMESDNCLQRLVSKDIKSSIDDVSVLFEESTEYELRVETFTLARGQNFLEMFVLILASLYVYWIHIVQYPKKLEGSPMFLQKFLFGNRLWNKNTTEGSATYIKSRKSCHLDLKLQIKFITFSYFLLLIIFYGLVCRHC